MQTPAESMTPNHATPRPRPLTREAQQSPLPQAGVAAPHRLRPPSRGPGLPPSAGVTVPIFWRDAASGPQARLPWACDADADPEMLAVPRSCSPSPSPGTPTLPKAAGSGRRDGNQEARLQDGDSVLFPALSTPGRPFHPQRTLPPITNETVGNGPGNSAQATCPEDLKAGLTRTLVRDCPSQPRS